MLQQGGRCLQGGRPTGSRSDGRLAVNRPRAQIETRQWLDELGSGGQPRRLFLRACDDRSSRRYQALWRARDSFKRILWAESAVFWFRSSSSVDSVGLASLLKRCGVITPATGTPYGGAYAAQMSGMVSRRSGWPASVRMVLPRTRGAFPSLVPNFRIAICRG
jgi:hypothetical protein